MIGVLWVLMWARLGRENRIMKERENILSITKRKNGEINGYLERKRLMVAKSVSLSPSCSSLDLVVIVYLFIFGF